MLLVSYLYAIRKLLVRWMYLLVLLLYAHCTLIASWLCAHCTLVVLAFAYSFLGLKVGTGLTIAICAMPCALACFCAYYA